MERTIHNPWTWQEGLGFVQGVEVTGSSRVLYCAGQAAADAEGNPQSDLDYAAQFEVALGNLRTVLEAADMTLANVVRLNLACLDVQQHFDALGTVVELAARHDLSAAGTLLQVSGLAMPGLLLEIEATAVA